MWCEWVKYITVVSLELAATKVSDYYLKFYWRWTSNRIYFFMDYNHLFSTEIKTCKIKKKTSNLKMAATKMKKTKIECRKSDC